MADGTCLAASTKDSSIHSMTQKQTPGLDNMSLNKVDTSVEGQIEEAHPKKKPFTTLSAMSLGWSITNTGLGMVLIVGNSVFGGGPLFVYGVISMFLISLSVAVTLGELTSAFPHAGGQYFWVAQLAPEHSRRFLSYMTAIISWASVICICASGAAGPTNIIFAMVELTRPDFVYRQWMGFLCFLCITWSASAMVVYERALPTISRFMLYWSIATMLAVVICLLAPNKPKQSAAVVFGVGEYYNLSGWPDGMAFLVGLGGINWGFSCLDAATHLAEEIPEPRKNIPKALLYTTVTGLLVGLSVVLAMFFAATDLETATSILGLLYSVYDGDPRCAYVLGTAILILAWGAVIGCHTWHSRIAWSLSRDKGFPFHRHMQTLAPAPFYTPLWSILWGSCWVSICGLLYLASLTAFNAFISSGIILQYMTYSLPAFLLLRKGRKTFAHGPFWLPKAGMVANVVLIVWTIFTTVIYSFPYFLPVEASTMNYVCVVVVLAFLYAGAYWIFHGHKSYILVDLRVVLE